MRGVMPHPDPSMYDDTYPTCTETYSTLRVFSDQMEPKGLTGALGVEPTSSFRKGDAYGDGRHRKVNGWFYSTEGLSTSRDTSRHLDLLVDALEGKIRVLDRLREQGCNIDIVSYWVSTGQGGPQLQPHQMLKLGALGLPVWWDIYFESGDEA